MTLVRRDWGVVRTGAVDRVRRERKFLVQGFRNDRSRVIRGGGIIDDTFRWRGNVNRKEWKWGIFFENVSVSGWRSDFKWPDWHNRFGLGYDHGWTAITVELCTLDISLNDSNECLMDRVIRYPCQTTYYIHHYPHNLWTSPQTQLLHLYRFTNRNCHNCHQVLTGM